MATARFARVRNLIPLPFSLPRAAAIYNHAYWMQRKFSETIYKINNLLLITLKFINTMLTFLMFLSLHEEKIQNNVNINNEYKRSFFTFISIIVIYFKHTHTHTQISTTKNISSHNKKDVVKN